MKVKSIIYSVHIGFEMSRPFQNTRPDKLFGHFEKSNGRFETARTHRL